MDTGSSLNVLPKIVIVCGEEVYMVSHMSTFRYVEVEGEVHETPFQAFEAVQMINIPYPKVKKPEVSMSSLKDVKEIIEASHQEGRGRVLDLPSKFNKLGLGYVPHETNSGSKTQNTVKFSSAGFINEGQANAIDDDKDNGFDFSKWIPPTVQELCNWSTEDVIQVTFSNE